MKTSPVTKAITFGSEEFVPGDPGLFGRLIQPWTIADMPETDPRWRLIVEAKRKELAAKIRWRKLKAAIGLAKPLAGFRQQSYVKREYDRIWAGHHWPQPVAASENEPSHVARPGSCGEQGRREPTPP